MGAGAKRVGKAMPVVHSSAVGLFYALTLPLVATGYQGGYQGDCPLGLGHRQQWHFGKVTVIAGIEGQQGVAEGAGLCAD